MTEKVFLLTRRELETLPCWAIVAFGARCARRALPLFRDWVGSRQELSEAVTGAVKFTENVAAEASHGETSESDDASLGAAEAALFAAGCAADLHDYPALAAAHAARSADYAARAASHAACYVRRGNFRYAAQDAAEDVSKSAIYAHYSLEGLNAKDQACVAMRQDYDRLLEAVNRERWPEDQGVVSEFFGPLWPEGLTPEKLSPEGSRYDQASRS